MIEMTIWINIEILECNWIILINTPVLVMNFELYLSNYFIEIYAGYVYNK